MKIKLEGMHQRIDITESIMWEIREKMNIGYIMDNTKNLIHSCDISVVVT